MQLLQMKIAYISDQQYPIQKADSEQVINTVSALAAEGVQIDLVVPRNWRNLGMAKGLRKKRLLEFYHLKDGFHLAELLHLPFSSLRLEKFTHGMLAPLYAKLLHYDIVYTRNPLPALISLLLGLKVVFETYRIYNRLNFIVAKCLAKLTQFDNFWGIITHSNPAKVSLMKCAANEKKIAVIHNGYNPELFNSTLTKSEARRILRLDENEKIACYTGRLDQDKGIRTLIDLAERTPEINFVLIGKTQKDSEDWIEKVAMKKRLKNIRCIPWMKTNELTNYLIASDVLLIPPTAEPMVKYGKTVLPLKIFLYLGAGRPILAPVLPDSETVLNRRNAALVEPDNVTAAQNCIRQIFADEAWANSLAKQAKLDSKNFTWQCRAKKILSFLNERLQEHEPREMFTISRGKKLAVAVLLNRLFEWSQNFITRELLELQRQGVELHIAARKIIKRDDLTHEELDLQNNFILIPENPFKPVSVWKHIKFKITHPVNYFRAWTHFFTFGHTRPSKIGRSLVCLFRAASIAEMFLEKKITLIHAHFMTAPTETALYLSALTGIPFGCTAHAMDIYQDTSGMPKKLAQASYVITVTEANVQYFKKKWKISPAKIYQIYCGIPQTRNYNLTRKPHVPFTFLAVGRLVPKKGFEYLIKACEILKGQGLSFHCKIVGKGPLEDALIALAKTLDVTDVVQFAGYIPPNQIQTIYNQGDVLVMPSIIASNGDRDGLPTVCIEALSYGLPLICTEVSGLPECVHEDQNGKVVPQKNPTALAQAMAAMMSAKNFKALCENSVRIGLEKFDGTKNVARIMEIMQRHSKSIISSLKSEISAQKAKS